MPIHDWTRVEAGLFHDFHSAWLAEIRKSLNGGLLPSDYYALIEQHARGSIPDILTLHTELLEPVSPALQGGVALAEAPPRVERTQVFAAPHPAAKGSRRTLVVRHVSGHRIIAMLEVVSSANKDRPRHVTQFARKVAGVVRAGVHVLVIDLYPPGIHDPEGMHAEVADLLDATVSPYILPAGEPLTFASYAAGRGPKAYLVHRAVGAALPEMPLFLSAARYVNVPLETTYQAAYRAVPAFWRNVLEGNEGR